MERSRSEKCDREEFVGRGDVFSMKPLAWVNHAVQAVATEENEHSGGIDRENGHRQLYVDKDSAYRLSTRRLSYTQRSRHSKIPPALDLRAEYNIPAPAIWKDSFEPETPPLSKPVFDDSSAGGLINATTEFDVKALDFSENDSQKYADSEYSSTDVSEAPEKVCSHMNHVKEVSATIFQSSSSPISIVLTTPIEETSAPVTEPPVLPRNAESFPLATLKSDHFNQVNPSFLMPPTDNQLNPRHLRKAQEVREIRKWLITFLNQKGDRFPRKVRLRMMDLYCIREFDLAPDMVAKFKAEVQDEGVALERQDDGGDAQGLSILGAALRSQAEEVTPRKEKMVALPPPPSWQRQGSPRKLETRIPDKAVSVESVKPKKDSRPATPTGEVDMVFPSCLGPLISTSTYSRDSLLADEQYLKKASSAPNLKGARPQLDSTDSTHSVPGLRPRESTMEGEDARRKENKRSIFGAMKNAMRWPSKRDPQKKKGYGD